MLLHEEILRSIFAGMGRDIESLGLAEVTFDKLPHGHPALDAAAQGVLRLLGGSSTGSRDGLHLASLIRRPICGSTSRRRPRARPTSIDAVGESLIEWLVRPASIILRAPKGAGHECPRCGRRHLAEEHASAPNA